MKTVAEFVRTTREKKKLSQKDLAKVVGCSSQTISSIEQGKTQIMPDKLKTISKALRVNQGTLLNLVVNDFKTNYSAQMKAR